MQSPHQNHRDLTVGAQGAMLLLVATSTLLFFQPVLAQSTITVTTTADNLSNNGDCSLREAIESARRDVSVDACTAGNGDDTIVLPAGVFSITLPGASEDDNQTGDYDLAGSIHITGAGADRTVIAGGELDRVFHVHPNATVRLTGIKLNGGLAPKLEPGGAILNEGELAIQAMVIENSRTSDGAVCGSESQCDTTSGPGGAIANSGTLTMTASTVRSNLAGLEGYYYNSGHALFRNAVGGGIYNTGNLRLVRCEVTDNRASEGAGVYNRGVAAIIDTAIFSNSTTLERIYRQIPYGSGQNSGAGAGILNDTAGTLALGSSVVFNNATPDGTWGNRGSGGSGGPGGGILNRGTLLAANSTIAQNSTGSGATGTWGGYGGNGGNGGGLYNTGTAVLNSVTIANNSSGVLGYGYGYSIDDPPQNGIDGVGGGVFNTGAIRIKNTIVAQNWTAGVQPDCAGNAITSLGFNLISQRECAGVNTNSDLLGLAPHLGAVANYGGPTGTSPLFKSSPAIDAGSCTDTNDQLVTHDQRGYARPQMTTCDIGAYETTAKDEFAYLQLPLLIKSAPE